MKENRTIEDECYRLGIWCLVFGCIACFVYLFLVVPILPKDYCFFWRFLGMYCPGCGGTRAVRALFQGNLLLSLWYHPLVIYTAVIFGGFMLTHTLEKLKIPHVKGWKFHNWYLLGALGIVVVNFVVKNVLLLAFEITL